MSLLTDKKLQELVTHGTPIVTGLPVPPATWVKDSPLWYGKDSPVQPASIDLHIGEIFLPGANKEEPGNESAPLETYVLERGQTAVVRMLEEVALPAELAGIGFPPSHVSEMGILMTNPGHIDPGFKGKLRLTIINMGSKSFELRKCDIILTVLIFQLNPPAHKDYLNRPDPTPHSHNIQPTLDRLSPDFLDINSRAKKIADDAVFKAQLWSGGIATVVTALVGIITIFLANSLEPKWKEPLDKIDQRVTGLEKMEFTQDVGKRLEKLESLVNGAGVQAKVPTNGVDSGHNASAPTKK